VTFRGKEPCPHCRVPVLGSWEDAEGWRGKDRFVPDEHGCPGRVTVKIEREGVSEELKRAVVDGAEVDFLQREPDVAYCRFDAIRITRTATGHRITFEWKGRDIVDTNVAMGALRVDDSLHITNIEGRLQLRLTT
jgi:hypothetical protein